MDFILGKIDLSVGNRSESVQAPVAYEMPREVVTEAIVNAVAHRDYTDGSSAILPKKQETLPKNQEVPTPMLPQKAVVRLGGLPENAFSPSCAATPP